MGDERKKNAEGVILGEGGDPLQLVRTFGSPMNQRGDLNWGKGIQRGGHFTGLRI